MTSNAERMLHSGTPVAGRREACLFRVSEEEGVWQVSRDAVFWGGFFSRGDAVRAACFGARAEQKRGRAIRVLAAPDDEVIAPYEPHFGL